MFSAGNQQMMSTKHLFLDFTSINTSPICMFTSKKHLRKQQKQQHIDEMMKLIYPEENGFIDISAKQPRKPMPRKPIKSMDAAGRRLAKKRAYYRDYMKARREALKLARSLAKPRKTASEETILLNFLKDLFDSARNRVKYGKGKATTCSITFEDVLALWHDQKGLCAYSGRPMEYKRHRIPGRKHVKNPHQVSIDRLDSSKGYEPGNIVLCCALVNSFKNDLNHSDFQVWINTLASHDYCAGNTHITFAQTNPTSNIGVNALI